MGLQGLAHIAVMTRDLEQSIQFYERLGGKLSKRGQAQKPGGVNHLALVKLTDFEIELIEPYDKATMPLEAQGAPLPHFAIAVDDLEQAAQTLRAAGVDTFQTAAPNVLPELFGGLRNWFLTGPSGELIELMQPMG